jgi:hypothetical protein
MRFLLRYGNPLIMRENARLQLRERAMTRRLREQERYMRLRALQERLSYHYAAGTSRQPHSGTGGQNESTGTGDRGGRKM